MRAIPWLVLLIAAAPLAADEFTFENDAGDEVTVEARLAGQGQEVLALELADGRLVLIPEKRLRNHREKSGPTVATHAEVEAGIMGMFVEGRVLTLVAEPYVLGLVLKRAETDARTLKRKAQSLAKLARLFGSLETKFRSFVRATRVPVQPLAFPLVVLVFESDENFESYARLVTGDADLPAATIAGFYDLRSNHLVLRVTTLDDYSTLIHEGVHQQVYNRRIVQRFAPVPVWFNEGIATAFEGDGETLRSDPKIPSQKYAAAALAARAVDWSELVQHDRTFSSAALAGEAYGGAWGLHWLLATKHRAAYAKYVRLMSEKQPLAVDDPETRLKEFEATIGVPVAELRLEFEEAVRLALKRKGG